MSIPRTEIIETLDALAGPLGPQTSLDERLERQDRWVDEGGIELLEGLLAVVASPPSEDQLEYASLDDWNTLLVEVAGALGKRHPEEAHGGEAGCEVARRPRATACRLPAAFVPRGGNAAHVRQ